jgi:hypothetical protein
MLQNCVPSYFQLKSYLQIDCWAIHCAWHIDHSYSCLVLYCIVLYCIVLYCIVLYFSGSLKKTSVTVENCEWSSASFFVAQETCLCAQLIKHITIKGYGGVNEYIHVFLTSAIFGDEWSASGPGRFTSGERAPGTDCIGGWVDPRAGLDEVEKRKFLTLLGHELRPLGHPARSQSWIDLAAC